MKLKLFLAVIAVLLSLVALLHLLRLVFQWDFIIGSYEVPEFINIIAIGILSFLVYQAIRLIKRI